MNKRIVFLASSMAILLVPGLTHARLYNVNSGRFMTLDTYEGSKTDPQSLHKYVYAHADPVDNTDPSGKAVYKVQYKSSIHLGPFYVDHRVIVGDTGTNYSSSSYVLEFWGNDGVFTGTKIDPIKHAKWYYTPKAISASDTIQKLIQEAGGGKLDETVVTSVNVDQQLNQEAAKMDGKPGTWVLGFNDCGTGANEWLYKASQDEFQTLHISPSTGGANYIYNFSADIGTITGLGM
jgi:hypothetical protein